MNGTNYLAKRDEESASMLINSQTWMKLVWLSLQIRSARRWRRHLGNASNCFSWKLPGLLTKQMFPNCKGLHTSLEEHRLIKMVFSLPLPSVHHHCCGRKKDAPARMSSSTEPGGVMPSRGTLQMWLSNGSWDEEVTLNYLGGPDVITEALGGERQEMKVRGVRREAEVRRMRRGHARRGVGSLWSWKKQGTKKTDFSVSASWRSTVLRTPWF